MALRNYCFILLVVVYIVLCGCGTGGSAESLAEECASKLPEVMMCVPFASGKEATPQQKCCESVTDMKKSNPACLCFMIQQIHNGTNPALQKMNIQESRLLQLPSACKIANASVSDCPKLLNLPPNSPDAAIFKNNGSTTSSPTTGGTTSSPSTSDSYGFKHGEPTFLTSAMVYVLLFVVVFSISGFGA
ncbi:non-specific lipid transfer protein GPI-anchored 1 [Cynara cardunculus var. scolymus]|uniref:Bifunctional inhibitor/plant lipid transfer protein/seed storage helical domain-containing protein n=1 Tax=Cynara cardunculus var. scolymus TaxID=59895 RepID=A0A124SDS6_CYNCS|nr:non-specific lipid transfer protein GPI-anchored 1 [Cynara cardunculus var. scolymus]KVH97825.1 Bifunctional inhibitor/plant lipid transfer protein/seed storage helical domain-containing protein [Cynara cardunculus var. scolymus]